VVRIGFDNKRAAPPFDESGEGRIGTCVHRPHDYIVDPIGLELDDLVDPLSRLGAIVKTSPGREQAQPHRSSG